VIVSCHAAPQCADAYHAYLAGGSPPVPAFSPRGNVQVAPHLTVVTSTSARSGVAVLVQDALAASVVVRSKY
jgi:hypothetical protein